MAPTVVSTIPAAKLALVNLITEALRAEYPTVPVQYGMQHQAKGTRVVVGDTNDDRGSEGRTWRALKSVNPVSKVDESYALPVTLHRVGNDEDTMQDVVESAFAMFALIDSTLRTRENITLGTPGVISVQVQLPAHEEITATGPAFGCVIHSAVSVYAQV